MPCEQYRDALTDVAAGLEASPGLEAHLASCEACRVELQVLRRALAVADAELAGLLATEPTAELAARIRQAVAGTEPSLPWRFGWLWPATAAAATLLVALALVTSRRTPSTPEDRAVVHSQLPEAPASPRATEAAGQPVARPAPRSVPGVDGKGRVTPRSADPVGRPGVRRPAVSPPEVLVPTSEAEALLRFAAHVQTRAVSPDSLLVADLSAPLPEPKGVEIEPLVIVPLDPAETSGTD
jgi:hypothetical protein